MLNRLFRHIAARGLQLLGYITLLSVLVVVLLAMITLGIMATSGNPLLVIAFFVVGGIAVALVQWLDKRVLTLLLDTLPKQILQQ